ncbi:MAG: type II toxin-antitoxin system RnlB family antitoxin [Clostridiales bacterium]|nr:type II toxin-antitoxin system RnlB family antitoxin [Clostridiales bacterium]MDY3747536.1 type II toxin-antitoxin system RnlB family antitoxin [Lachnospiraceae bacterium]
MEAFDIIVVNEDKKSILVVMKTSESPFDYISEIELELRERCYIGAVIIDELLHSGNTEERFIKGYFDGKHFDSSQFAYETVDKKSKLREHICLYLFSDKESRELSILTSRQQKLIEHGCII